MTSTPHIVKIHRHLRVLMEIGRSRPKQLSELASVQMWVRTNNEVLVDLFVITQYTCSINSGTRPSLQHTISAMCLWRSPLCAVVSWQVPIAATGTGVQEGSGETLCWPLRSPEVKSSLWVCQTVVDNLTYHTWSRQCGSTDIRMMS